MYVCMYVCMNFTKKEWKQDFLKLELEQKPEIVQNSSYYMNVNVLLACFTYRYSNRKMIITNLKLCNMDPT